MIPIPVRMASTVAPRPDIEAPSCPIPFSDLGTEGITANVAYLRFTEEPEGEGLRAALFIISCRGEPLEFCFTRVEVPHSPLWQTGQARDFAVIALAEALFEAANRLPNLVLALASETSARCFFGRVSRPRSSVSSFYTRLRSRGNLGRSRASVRLFVPLLGEWEAAGRFRSGNSGGTPSV